MNKPKRKYRTIAWWQVTVIVVAIAVVGIVVVRFSSAASSNSNLASSIQKEYLRLRAEQLAKQKPPAPAPKPTPPPTLPKPTPTPTKPTAPNTTTTKQQSSQLLSSLSTNISQQQKSTTSQAGSKTTATLSRNTLQSDPASTEEQENILSELPVADIPTLSSVVIFEPTIPSGTQRPLVAYYINRKLAYYSEKPPYKFNLDTVDLDNGTYVLNTVVFDAQEKQVARYDYKFNVQNSLSFWQRLQRTITTPFRAIFQ